MTRPYFAERRNEKDPPDGEGRKAPETPTDEPPPMPIQDPPSDATPPPPMTAQSASF